MLLQSDGTAFLPFRSQEPLQKPTTAPGSTINVQGPYFPVVPVANPAVPTTVSESNTTTVATGSSGTIAGGITDVFDTIGTSLGIGTGTTAGTQAGSGGPNLLLLGLGVLLFWFLLR